MKKYSTGVVIPVAMLLVVVTLANMWMIFGQNRRNTLDSGTYRLEAVSGELEGTISNAGELTLELALKCREYLDDMDALRGFIRQSKSDAIADGKGVFNVYAAGSYWCYIPDFDMPDDYVAQERVWYYGAARNKGDIYVSPPYTDAMTGDICYTVSVMLGDGETVLAVDYTMENIQAHIEEMYSSGRGTAVIVTDEGIIAGCTDETLVGQVLADAIPEYAGMYSLARNREGVSAVRLRKGLQTETLFATKSGNGWYLIISEREWELYRDSYIQLACTVGFSVLLLSLIIILYIRAVRNERQAQYALETKEEFLNKITRELKDPLDKILNYSETGFGEEIETTGQYRKNLADIHTAGESLSGMIAQMLSYSSIVRTASKGREGVKPKKVRSINRRFRAFILVLMIALMVVSMNSNISASYRWGSELMRSEAQKYEYGLDEWINTQKSILDMFASAVSTNASLLDDYDAAVSFLDGITVQYPEISVTYMAMPDRDPSVYMNNGWKPEPGWRVEDRPWYKECLASPTGWSISTPYIDDQTGAYCVTISKMVYDAENGEFLGIFGIDFFMDKLIEILGDSYSDTGYAFLVDTDGDIINHPYGSYQMTSEGQTNISGLPYREAVPGSGRVHLIHDYDGRWRIITAIRNEVSDFTVYAAVDIWKIFGSVLIYGLICLITFVVCIALIDHLLADLIKTQEETNRHMQEAADAAIAAGEAKSRFLAQMSHEIRTPINAVLGMNEMILRRSENREIREYSENIRSAGRTLLSLINSILDFSKIEDGKMEIVPVKYEISSLINNLVNSISTRAQAKSLEFIVDVDRNLPSVLYGDDIRIEQVIMNLLTNAVKYTEKGSVTLTVKEWDCHENKVILFVSVRDTGIGIRKEDMGRLFESFERLDEEKNRNIEGTGLGMSIVTRLLEMMDSKLIVESEYGKGSVFSFLITQTILDETPVGDYTARLEKSRQTIDEDIYLYAPDARVLIVDDNEMNLKVADSLLKIFRIIPELANSGKSAIEMITRKDYDIVFLDHMMPVMDGIETLEELKKTGTKLPVMIVLTANAVVGAREEYIKTGFTDYLSKPIEIGELQNLLKKYLPEDKVKNSSKYDDEVVEFAPKELKEASLTNELTDLLNNLDIDTETGIRYCNGSADLYIDILKEYAADKEEKISEIESAYAKKDWKLYATYVHAVKSTSRMIGANEHSEVALKLENAAKSEDSAIIDELHASFMADHKHLVDGINGILG